MTAGRLERPGPVRDRVAVGLVAAFTFLLRVVLSSRESYWLDELFSVYVFAVRHDSLGSAIRDLAETSIHPPAYQIVLYQWIQLFGDTEVATRTLSNLYVAVATFLMYLLVRRLFGSITGVAAAAAFGLSFAATYYGMETRSYGQVLLLIVASSYALVAYLDRIRAEDTWWSAHVSGPAFALLAINVALLLTHYTALFFWAAQALFVAVHVHVPMAAERKHRDAAFRFAAMNYLLQVGVFLVLWGSVLRRSPGRAGAEPTDIPEHNPIDIVATLTEHVYNFGPLDTVAALVIAAGALACSVALRGRRKSSRTPRQHPLGIAYFATTVVVPVVLVYLFFLAVQAERFHPRFYLFLVPGITILVLIAARDTVDGAFHILRRRVSRPAPGHLARFGLVYTTIFVLVFVVQGTIQGATQDKEDWRGTAEDVVAVIQGDPESQYAIYQTSYRPMAVIDYYLDRFGGDLRAHGVITVFDEEDQDLPLERSIESLDGFDYLIVVFVHHRTETFPHTVEYLADAFAVHETRIDTTGQGFIVFALGGRT